MTAALDADRWRRVEQVLDVVLASDPRRWSTLVAELCAGDDALRSEVESLLKHADAARDFLNTPPVISAAALIEESLEAEPETSAGRRIGPYRILRELGRGGMSRVFLAERAEGGFTHEVALKLLRPGLDTDIDHARFRAERQILASLNHPNIARLLDGGTSEDGLPYFVLERVDGQPIDEYANERGLSVDERITLFLTVCAATQDAHRSLVVHRDLKPSNILVNGEGVVKLLDFGLAKLLEPSGRVGPRETRTAQRWLTPEYAAPEQIRGDAVTTLTDVYQLGAVLYELLTGEPPFAERTDSVHAFEESVLRNEPEPPSSRATRREAFNVAKQLRGDLDAIVLKALRKEPEQRFDSVEALARDLRAHLSGHPVLARRATTWYRARRFVRRHRVETVAAVGAALSLIVGAGMSLSEARRAAGERDRAEQALHASDAVSSFLMRVFEASDPAEAKGDTLTAAELVRRAAARAEALTGQPMVQARMLEVTSRLYRSLGKYGESYGVLQRALGLRQKAQTNDDLETAALQRMIAGALVSLARFDAADSAARRALAIQERILGPTSPQVGATLHQMTDIAVFRGDLARAERYIRRALAVNERVFGSEDSVTATSHLVLGAILQREGRFAEAETQYRRALAVYERTLGGSNPQVAEAVLHLGYLFNDIYGRYAEAEPLYRRGVEIRRRAYGDGHPLVAYAMDDLSGVLAHRGDYAGAVAMARESFGIVRRAYGAQHPVVATATQHLAKTLFDASHFAEAESLYRRSIALHRQLRGLDDETASGAETELAQLLMQQRRYHDAEPLIQDAIRVRTRAYGPDHTLTAKAEALLGVLLTHKAAYSAADSVLHHSIRVFERQVSREHPDVREVYGWLADLETARGRYDDAARYRAIAVAR